MDDCDPYADEAQLDLQLLREISQSRNRRQPEPEPELDETVELPSDLLQEDGD